MKDLSKSVLSTVLNFPNEYRSRILKMALLAHSSTTQDHSLVVENFSRETNTQKDQIYDILGVYIALIKLFLETDNDNDFNVKVSELGFTPSFVENLPLLGKREEIVSNLMKNQDADFGKLSLFRWRIDISLSNSTLVKKVPMNVLVSFTMKNGKQYKIQIDTREFHRLRFNIALILKELNSLK